jgi:hypothetical protein
MPQNFPNHNVKTWLGSWYFRKFCQWREILLFIFYKCLTMCSCYDNITGFGSLIIRFTGVSLLHVGQERFTELAYIFFYNLFKI